MKTLSESVDQWGVPLLESLKIKSIQWRVPTEKELKDEFNEADIESLLISHSGYPSKREIEEAWVFFKSNLEQMEIDPKDLDPKNQWRFRFKDYSTMRKQVKGYGGPKDPDSLVRAIQAGQFLPMPVVIKQADGRLMLAGGATRTAIAGLADQKITALVIDEKKVLRVHVDKAKANIQKYISKSKPEVEKISARVEELSRSLDAGDIEEVLEAEYPESGFEVMHLSLLWSKIREMEKALGVS